jgi:hypothetical protein
MKRHLDFPQFFVARDQGKSPPRLHKARAEVIWIKARNVIETHVPPWDSSSQTLKRLGR